MNPRISCAHFLVKLGNFLSRLGQFLSQSLAVMVMRDEDLTKFSQQAYIRQVKLWSHEDFVDKGLGLEENLLLEKLPLQKGRLLLLLIGGGREAIPLAQRGFEITGVDFVPEMLEKAKENAMKRGIVIHGLLQEISTLDVPENYYDVVWIYAAMYSCIPTRAKRVETLKRIKRALRPGGYFACQFLWYTYSPLKIGEFIKKCFALLTLGNLKYEQGDTLFKGEAFMHIFSSEDAVRLEFEEAGFELTYINIFKNKNNGIALLRKPLP